MEFIEPAATVLAWLFIVNVACSLILCVLADLAPHREDLVTKEDQERLHRLRESINKRKDRLRRVHLKRVLEDQDFVRMSTAEIGRKRA